MDIETESPTDLMTSMTEAFEPWEPGPSGILFICFSTVGKLPIVLQHNMERHPDSKKWREASTK